MVMDTGTITFPGHNSVHDTKMQVRATVENYEEIKPAVPAPPTGVVEKERGGQNVRRKNEI